MLKRWIINILPKMPCSSIRVFLSAYINSFCFSNHFLGRGRRQTMPSCGNPEKSAGLRFSLIFPTAAPTHAPFTCHRHRLRVLPGTRVPRFKNFVHKQKIQAPQSDACISGRGRRTWRMLRRCLAYWWLGDRNSANFSTHLTALR